MLLYLPPQMLLQHHGYHVQLSLDFGRSVIVFYTTTPPFDSTRQYNGRCEKNWTGGKVSSCCVCTTAVWFAKGMRHDLEIDVFQISTQNAKR